MADSEDEESEIQFSDGSDENKNKNKSYCHITQLAMSDIKSETYIKIKNGTKWYG